MKVLFVRPQPSHETIGLQHLMIVEPLELEILATLIMERHEVRIVDMILEKKTFEFFLNEFQPDVVCLTGYITHIPIIIQYCLESKRFNSNIITIAGGIHIEKFPEDINHPQVDFRVVRNATRCFPQLIDFINNKTIFPQGILKYNETIVESQLPEIDFYTPIPNRSLTQRYRKQYFYVFHNKVALIKTSFGCPYKCKFCFCRKITDDKYFAKPLTEIIEELKTIHEKEIYIVDDDFLVCTERIEAFINLLRINKIDKRYLIYGRADFIASNPEIIREFKQLGLRTIIVGIESFEDTELIDFNKQTSCKINQQALSILNQNGIDCYAAIIVSPSWDKHDFRKAGDMMLQLGLKFINLQPLTPIKGTGLEIAEDELIVNRKDFARWDLAHVIICPQQMKLHEYYRQIMKLYFRILFHPGNLISNLKFPIYMQYKVFRGVYKVSKQYRQKFIEASKHA